MMKKVLAGLAIAAGLFASTGVASAQTTLRVANWLPPSHPLVSDIIKPWIEDVNKATEGRVVLELLTSPLGPPPSPPTAATGPGRTPRGPTSPRWSGSSSTTS